ncbi:unnamed protein product [Caenorhabditis auriculariae]|uniref:C6 domain-containing protein n=1 Tax=Caenorhabditis auriculariae TaxID=2777116 RepID=A0A8S1HXF4_9PELO|nr:unnamed protein product [Caenorhabditis auriculariae]
MTLSRIVATVALLGAVADACLATQPGDTVTTTPSGAVTTVSTATTAAPQGCQACAQGDVEFTQGDGGININTMGTFGSDPTSGCLSLTASCTADVGFNAFMQFNGNQGGPAENMNAGRTVSAQLNCIDGQWVYMSMGISRFVTSVSCQQAPDSCQRNINTTRDVFSVGIVTKSIRKANKRRSSAAVAMNVCATFLLLLSVLAVDARRKRRSAYFSRPQQDSYGPGSYWQSNQQPYGAGWQNDWYGQQQQQYYPGRYYQPQYRQEELYETQRSSYSRPSYSRPEMMPPYETPKPEPVIQTYEPPKPSYSRPEPVPTYEAPKSSYSRPEPVAAPYESPKSSYSRPEPVAPYEAPKPSYSGTGAVEIPRTQPQPEYPSTQLSPPEPQPAPPPPSPADEQFSQLTTLPSVIPAEPQEVDAARREQEISRMVRGNGPPGVDVSAALPPQAAVPDIPPPPSR